MLKTNLKMLGTDLKNVGNRFEKYWELAKKVVGPTFFVLRYRDFLVGELLYI